ncbi:MAG: PQQ-binding-like beta-propeller repeat protein, partial [Chitinivibrionales bacterium]|nr:PQQ-binding-like beta-propeller repeat protein [Chitinivibrionales bacterium]
MNNTKIILILILCNVSHAADWPAFRGNLQRTGFTAEKVGLPEGKPLWRFGPVGAVVSSPSVAGNTVYFGSRDSTIYALDALSGVVKWQKKVYGWVDSSPFIFGDSLVVGCRDGRIYILDKTTGESRNELVAGVQLSSPAVLSDGTVLTLVGPPYNSFAKYRAGETESGWSLFFSQPMYSSPAVEGPLAAFGGNDGYLYGVALADRRVLWAKLTTGTSYLSTPAIESGVVFFAPGDFDKNVYAVNLSDGAEIWKSAGNPALGKTHQEESTRMPPQMLNNLRR